MLRGYVGERRGEREEMQDAHAIHDDLTPLFTDLPAEMLVRACAVISVRYALWSYPALQLPRSLLRSV